MEEKLDDLYDSTDEKTKQLQELPQLRGPIAASLDNTLKKNITIQTHHGGSFKGNQCNEYIQQATTENICQSVVRKTYEVTDNHNLHNRADDIAEQHLNFLCAQVHKLLSLTRPITGSEISLVGDPITNYVRLQKRVPASQNHN